MRFEEGRTLVWDWGRRGGGPLTTHLLIRRFLKEGYAGRLAASLSKQNELLAETRAPGLEVHTVETFERASLAGLLASLPRLRRAFAAHLERVQPETIIMTMLFGAAPFLADLARRGCARLIYMAHDSRVHPGDPAPRRIAAAQSLFIRLADETIAPSAFTAAALRRLHPHAADRISIMPLASLYEPRGRPRPEPKDRPLRFLCAGRLADYKGFDRLAGALRLTPSNAPFTLIIAGDGSARARVERLFADDPRAQLNFSWRSRAEHIALFDDCDVLLCPYDEASQSGVICDALAAGMPSVVTPIGGLPEQIGDGRAGVVLPDMSPAPLAALLTRGLPDYRRLSAGCLDILKNLKFSQHSSLFATPPG